MARWTRRRVVLGIVGGAVALGALAGLTIAAVYLSTSFVIAYAQVPESDLTGIPSAPPPAAAKVTPVGEAR